MTEGELQAETEALCSGLGLFWHHDGDARRSAGTPGFPDLVIAGPGGVLFAELKGENGETSAPQDRWWWMLHSGGQRYHLWSPADWRSGIIRVTLEALAGRQT